VVVQDRAHDTDWFRETLKNRGINAHIPCRKQRKAAIKYDKRRYKRRNHPSRDIAAQRTAGSDARSGSAINPT